MVSQGRTGDQAFCPADGHGCPACPHPVMGPAVMGSADVSVNGLSALRDGDPGIHAACCGPNQWTAAGGAPSVFINGKRAFRLGDPTSHCGGSGSLVQGSANVFVGNAGDAGNGRCLKDAARQGAPLVQYEPSMNMSS